VAHGTQIPASSASFTVASPKVQPIREPIAGGSILGCCRTVRTAPSKFRRAVQGNEDSDREPHSRYNIIYAGLAALVSPKKKKKGPRILLVAPRSVQMASNGFPRSSELLVVKFIPCY
jgi:hypothetical protein